MNKINKHIALAVVFCLLAASAAQARTRVGVYVGGAPYWGPQYAYPPYYPPPPPIVYAPPPVTYMVPLEPPSILADQTSPTYTDSQGRLCREYTTQKIIDGLAYPVSGTACLQPDGAWRIVE